MSKAKPMKLVIDRKRWLRGEGGNASFLYRRSDRRMCCLGFLGKACGYSAKIMSQVGSPDLLVGPDHGRWPTRIVNESGCDTSVCESLMHDNDAEGIPEDQREARITALMKKAGISVKFVGPKRKERP